MEIKKGIVKSVQSNGDLKLKHGIFFKFEIEIGEDVGEYLSKSEDGGNKNFPVGQEKEYQLTETSYGKKIKPHFQQNSFTPRQAFGENPDRQRMIVKQSSLKVASDLCIANKKTDLNFVFNMAEQIVAWVMDDKETSSAFGNTNKEVKKEMIKEAEKFASASGQSVHSDDLPF